MIPLVKNRAIALVISVLVFASGKQHVLLKVKVEKAEGRLLVVQNCTISKEPAVPIAAFLLNNKSLEDIRSSNESCFNSLGECQPQECECGVNYFIHIMTLPLEKPLYNFTCLVRFNEIFKRVTNHVVYQDSIFYNSSGMYPLNETKEVIGRPSPKEKPQSPNELDNSEHWIFVSIPIILVLASPIIVIYICRKQSQRCFKKEKQKRIPKKKNFVREDTYSKEADPILENNEDFQDPTTDSKVHTEKKHTAVVQIEQSIAREQNRVQEKSISNGCTSSGVNLLSDEKNTVALAIKSARTIAVNPLDDENIKLEEKSISNGCTSSGVNLLSDEKNTVALAIKSARSIAVNPLDDENIKLVCKDRKDMKESDDDEEEKFYPPELKIDTM